MALIKVKVKSLQELVDTRHDYNVDIHVDMLVYAGKEVTIDTNQEYFDGESYSGELYIDEDCGDSYWDPDMFVNFPEHLMPQTIDLLSDEEIDGNDSVKLHSDGAITVGCQTVEFSTLEKIFLAAKKHKEDVAKASKPKAKKKAAKKKTRKK